VRRAAEALGKVGDARALDALERLAPRAGPTKRSVAFAKSLISYRLGLDLHRIRRPPASDDPHVSPRQAIDIVPVRPRPQTVAQVMTDAAEEFPSVALSNRSAVHFACAGHEFVLLLATSFEDLSALDALTASHGVVGSVFERAPATHRYFLAEYLLSDPGPRATVRLIGVRPDGTVTHVGALRPKEGNFEVHSVNTPHSPPVDIAGQYDFTARRLTFDRFQVQPGLETTRKPPRQPTRLS
jgi:hypothetical protein